MTEEPPITDDSRSASETRCGTVALAGRSNVGKSTLLNRLLGAKVAITSRRPQTTRSRILGIRTLPGAQMIWVDTPGIHRARSLLNRRMVDAAARSIAEADVVVVRDRCRSGLSPAGPRGDRLRRREPSGRGSWRSTRLDLVADAALIPLLDGIGKALPDVDLVPVSASDGKESRRTRARGRRALAARAGSVSRGRAHRSKQPGARPGVRSRADLCRHRRRDSVQDRRSRRALRGEAAASTWCRRRSSSSVTPRSGS